MSRRRFRGVLTGLCCGAGLLAGPGTALAAADAPEAPPPAFVAPPPGYEPPTQYAQGAPPAPAVVEAPATFMTLDRMDASTRFGVQVGWDKIDQTPLSDGFLMRYEPYGQYVLPNKAIGLYGQVPISHAFNLNGADSGGLGNIELGGFFMPMHSNDLILRTGLVLATGPSTINNDFISNALVTFERMTDVVQAGAGYTTLRLSASTLQQRDKLFFRADVGFDLTVNKAAAGNAGDYFRGNVAAGVRATAVDVMLELVNIAALDGTVPGGIEGRLTHTAGISLRTQGEDQFHIGSVFPLDDGARGKIWIISVGYQRAMTM
ncbi:MAG TPA: hypothetical protein VKQ32_18000 [Polyangia bacterium]|nr:hypothetical protein [Polyangia bacterium]